jgi:amino acid permease
MNIAGPGGLLAAWAFVSVTAICVMEGLSEMIIMWPVSNAMVEYVKAFVDRDLAIVVGLAYWFVRRFISFFTLWDAAPDGAGTEFSHRYTWSSIFFTLLIAASNFSKYWIPHPTGRTILFYFVISIGLVIINSFGVKVCSASCRLFGYRADCAEVVWICGRRWRGAKTHLRFVWHHFYDRGCK